MIQNPIYNNNNFWRKYLHFGLCRSLGAEKHETITIFRYIPFFGWRNSYDMGHMVRAR